jgi:transposase
VIPASVKVWVCLEPTDMRRGFDRLALEAKAIVGDELHKGMALVVFANRGATRLKVLWFEKNGCCILYKRLHRAIFELPICAGSASVHIDTAALAKLLAGAPRSVGSRAAA